MRDSQDVRQQHEERIDPPGMMDCRDDIELVSRAAMRQDRRAFNALVRKYQEPIRRFFLNQTCGDTQLSDDLAQDTFVKAYLNIGKFRGQSAFATWLFRIAYNVFYDHTRSYRPTTDIDRLPQPRLKTEQRGMERMDIYKALQLLTETERTCVSLQLIEGQSIERIAEITHINQNTIKSHLARGKRKLITYLKANGYDR